MRTIALRLDPPYGETSNLTVGETNISGLTAAELEWIANIILTDGLGGDMDEVAVMLDDIRRYRENKLSESEQPPPYDG
jgi:hypothetical protein